MYKEKILMDALKQIEAGASPSNDREAYSWIGTAKEIASAALASCAEQAPPERSACLDKEEVLRDVKDIYAQSHHYKDWDNMWQNRGFNETDTDSSAIMAMDEWAKIKTLEGQVTGKSAENLIEALKEIVSPIQYMQNRLQEGEALNGVYAHELSRDSSYLKSIAEKALASYASAPALEGVTGWIYATDSLPDPFKVVPCKYTPDSPDPRKDTELHWGFVNKEGVWSKGWEHHQVEWLHESGEAGKQPEQQPTDLWTPLRYMEYVLHEYFKWEAYPNDVAESRAKEYASKFHSWLQNKQEGENDSE